MTSKTGPESGDELIASAERSVIRALTLNPSDSFLWLMVYSVRTIQYGFDLENLRLLAQSYAMGPYEGWISLRRNRSALAVLSMLSESTKSAVISEFAAMVDTDFIENTALNLRGVGWQYRERLLAALVSVDVVSRQKLYRRLKADGITVSVPGIPFDERPWR
ncbi:hypothetical protein [Bradyrhizobium yuanmingense]|nr:hypothetical protein [Bradyrhizobium yuanmingense]